MTVVTLLLLPNGMPPLVSIGGVRPYWPAERPDARGG